MQSNRNDKTASSCDAVKVQEFLGLLEVVEFHPSSDGDVIKVACVRHHFRLLHLSTTENMDFENGFY